MLAPPWIPVPPAGYGGIEEVVRLLCDELVARDVRVTLFGAPGSSSAAEVVPLLDAPHPDEIGRAVWEADHVARAFEAVDAAARDGDPFDVLHDHCGFTALAMADRLDAPVVHTVHGAFDEVTSACYAAHGHKATLVALSTSQRQLAPPALRRMPVVPNPLRVSEWPFQARKDDYLLWMGRMAAVKGAHRAITASRQAGMPLVLAGPVQPGQEQFFAAHVEPHIDGDAVRYVGEVGGSFKQNLLAGAAALLVPIRWAEPFGLVMIEAMACGTPVIAFPEGAARQIVVEGETGYLVADEDEMARAIGRVSEIDPQRCRQSAGRFDVAACVDRYLRVYRLAALWRARTAGRTIMSRTVPVGG
jgi:glycosyltransferase involved in cell wall biosynthesis